LRGAVPDGLHGGGQRRTRIRPPGRGRPATGPPRAAGGGAAGRRVVAVHGAGPLNGRPVPRGSDLRGHGQWPLRGHGRAGRAARRYLVPRERSATTTSVPGTAHGRGAATRTWYQVPVPAGLAAHRRRGTWYRVSAPPSAQRTGDGALRGGGDERGVLGEHARRV